MGAEHELLPPPCSPGAVFIQQGMADLGLGRSAALPGALPALPTGLAAQ